MELKRGRCLKCGADYEITSENHCPRCTVLTSSKNPSFSSVHNKIESARANAKPTEVNYVMQIVSIGIRSDNIYEAQMLLAPEVDMASIKITVKGKNLRVTVRKPFSETFARGLSEITGKSVATDLIKKTAKHSENLLIPENIDGDKVRAIIDNKHRILILTAPMTKPSKIRKNVKVQDLRNMENLPRYYQENAVLLKQNDFMNVEMMLDGVKRSFKFTRIPDFYTIDNKEYFGAEMRVEGFKVGTVVVASENILNVKLCASEGLPHERNINFFVPTEANIKRVSVEVHNDDIIFIKAPLKKGQTHKYRKIRQD